MPFPSVPLRAPQVTLAAILALSCATEANTLEPLDPDGTPSAKGGTTSGGSGNSAMAGTSTAGKTGTAGKTNTGGTAVNPFGGSANAGGTADSGGQQGEGGDDPGSGAGSGGSAGSAQGGSSTAGASAGGGASGGAGQANGGSSAGTSASGGTGGGAVGSGCLMNWRDNTACDTCTTQTQSDLKACAQVLDCYLQNDCGPSSCASNDDKCGVNVIKQGTAPYPVAKQVYDCVCK